MLNLVFSRGKGLSQKPCIAGILDSSDDVSQNVDSYKQKMPLLKMGGTLALAVLSFSKRETIKTFISMH